MRIVQLALCACGRSLSIDLRSLALLRISLGLLLLLDLVIRARSLSAHYTDEGVFPRTLRIAMYDAPNSQASYWWSFHMMSGAAWFQVLLFVIAAIAAGCLMVGYRTRLANFSSWMLLTSLHARSPELQAGGDVLLRALLFWCLFLPIAARASLDARWTAPRQEHGVRYVSPASAVILLQIALVYWVNAAMKSGPEWTRNFTAVYYALNFDLYATSFGKQLLDYPKVLRWLTFLTYSWEIVGPLIALCPLANGVCRGIAIAGFVLFHAALAACFHLGLFPFVAIAAWMVFLPSGFWQRRVWAKLEGELHTVRVAKVPAQETAVRAQPSRIQSSAVSAIALVLFLYVSGLQVFAVYQAKTGNAMRGDEPAMWWEVPSFVLGLEQAWNMFAPSPTADDGWFTFRGTLESGETTDLWNFDRSVTFDKPPQLSREFPDHRWRKYIANFRWNEDPRLLSALSTWLAKRWDAAHRGAGSSKSLKRVELYFTREETRPPAEPAKPPVTILLWDAEVVGEPMSETGAEGPGWSFI